MIPYFDCNATTPVEPDVATVVLRFLKEDFGNAGSRTHEFGQRANRAVAQARRAVAAVVDCDPSEVLFTSGATESNNLAILGLAEALRSQGRQHIVSTEVEHKAVLEPLERMADIGFEVTLLPPEPDGRISAGAIADALRPDTGLVSVMHVNNETGVINDVAAVAAVLIDHEALFHVDAAQGFGKADGLDCRRIDLMSVSGHKVFGPKGVGALVARRRECGRPPLRALMVGGGQERGLRPGTLPVHLIAGLGEAAKLAMSDRERRERRCREIRDALLRCFDGIPYTIHGDPEYSLISTLNISLHGVDAEAAIVCLKHVVAVSNGAACTSSSYTTSHVLRAMGVPDSRARESLRWSWCHMTPRPPVEGILNALQPLVSSSR